jgi:hypothetical protein
VSGLFKQVFLVGLLISLRTYISHTKQLDCNTDKVMISVSGIIRPGQFVHLSLIILPVAPPMLTSIPFDNYNYINVPIRLYFQWFCFPNFKLLHGFTQLVLINL